VTEGIAPTSRARAQPRYTTTCMRSISLTTATTTLMLVAAALVGCPRAPEYPACNADGDCPAGESCVDHQCQACRSDGDCPTANLVCVDFRCVEASPARCESSETCAAGLRCVEGSCSPCTDSSECPTGVCHESGRCEQPACATDDACPTAEICDGNQCLPEPLADASVCGVAKLAFALDSAQLSPGNQERLAHATPCLLEQLASATLSLAAHGDALGSEDYQQALAQRRAASVRAFLLGRGLPEDRVRVLEGLAGEPRSAQLSLTPST
jgi:hypothetical protein